MAKKIKKGRPLTRLGVVRKIVAEIPIEMYLGYREFMNAIIKQTKEQVSRYSMEAFAKDCGFENPRLMQAILQGERNLSLNKGEVLARSLKLVGQRRLYFLTLIEYCNAKDPVETSTHFQLLLQRKQKLLPKGKTRSMLIYLSDWIYPVIREMIQFDPKNADPQTLCENMYYKVNPRQAQEAVQLLLQLGLLEDKNGKLQATSEQIFPTREIINHASVAYHQKSSEKMSASILEVPSKLAEFNTAVVTVDQDRIPWLRGKMHELLSELFDLDSEKSEKEQAVVQVQLNFLQVSKQKKQE